MEALDFRITRSFVTVQFQEGLTHQELIERINHVANSHIFLWYIGSHGLKEAGVQFYKEKIKAILISPQTLSCNLVDFSSWGAFTNPRAKITAQHCCVEKINRFQIEKLKCIPASKIFQEIINTKQESINNYFKKRLVEMEWLFENSHSFKESTIKIRDIFNQNCPIFEGIYDLDANRCYSAVQYIEGCFLISEIVKNNLDQQHPINVVFALPNDEAKYYRGDSSSFEKDISFLLNEQFGERLDGREVTINFFNFEYGTETFHRPYNSGKKVLKNIKPSDLTD